MKISLNQNFIKIQDPEINISGDLDSFLDLFKPIKINQKTINVLDPIFSIGFCYFDLVDILDFTMPLVHVRKLYILYNLIKFICNFYISSKFFLIKDNMF